MALTGLGLVGFIITHLLGNLSLYQADGTAFNRYASTLESWGVLLTLAEIGLLILFLVHIVTGIRVSLRNKAARPVSYRAQRSKGGHSLSNTSSRNMFLSGLFLLAFLVLHVWQFRFGPGLQAGYAFESDGVTIRDLHRLVHEIFKNPFYVVFYLAAMVTLGMHLRHGFWSAFQSAGVMSGRATRSVHLLGAALAAILAIGFFFIPIWIYFDIAGALK